MSVFYRIIHYSLLKEPNLNILHDFAAEMKLFFRSMIKPYIESSLHIVISEGWVDIVAGDV